MGFRSIRLGLARPGLLRTQIRALLLAADGRPLKILVPMVTETFEFTQARLVVHKEIERLRRQGRRIPSRLELGAMVEVPSLLFELDQLMPEADFVSIGSNDLVQFLTASDRSNPCVAKSYDPIGMPRLRAIRMVVDAAQRYNIPVTMCGELAGKPLEALALMAIGMNRLSMGPASIGPIKELVLNLDLRPIRMSVGSALSDGANGVTIRELLQDWVDRQNLPMG
jgi:phosphotransferase system enzyme I (PtsP)